MNASKLLKAVLRPRSIQTNSGRGPAASDGPSSRRSLSPDSRLPKDFTSKRSAPPAKMTCMCSPTNHPGSFRCRFHRARKQSGVVALPSSPRRSSVRYSDILSEVNRTLPGMHPTTCRTTPIRCSRLKNVSFGSGREEEESFALSFQREYIGNLEGSIHDGFTASAHHKSNRSAPRINNNVSMELPTIFCQSTSKKALEAFDRNMTRMYV